MTTVESVFVIGGDRHCTWPYWMDYVRAVPSGDKPLQQYAFAVICGFCGARVSGSKRLGLLRHRGCIWDRP